MRAVSGTIDNLTIPKPWLQNEVRAVWRFLTVQAVVRISWSTVLINANYYLVIIYFTMCIYISKHNTTKCMRGNTVVLIACDLMVYNILHIKNPPPALGSLCWLQTCWGQTARRTSTYRQMVCPPPSASPSPSRTSLGPPCSSRTLWHLIRKMNSTLLKLYRWLTV